jgi:PAS domain S-box-containing protein
MSARPTGLEPPGGIARRLTRLPWSWIALASVLVLMLAGGVLFLQQYERKAHQEAHAWAQRELDLLATLIQTHLERGNYQGASQALQAWGGEQAHVVGLSLLSGNGFMLAEYRRPTASARGLSLETRIPYAYRHAAKLILVTDLGPVQHKTRTLALQLGGAYLLVALFSIGLTRLALLYRREAGAVRASEAQLEEAQALAHLGSWDLDLATGKANWSREEYRLFGYAPDAVEAGVAAFLARVHPDDVERVKTEMQAAMSREDGYYQIEHRVLLPDGTERIVLEQGRVSFDDTRRPLRMVGSTLDVTEVRRAERELEAHRHRLEELVVERTLKVREQAVIIDQIHDAVISTDLDGTITGWNLGAERLYGYSAGEAIGQHVAMLYFDREALEREVLVPLREQGAHEVELTLRRKDGSAIDVLLSLSMRLDDQGRPVGMIGFSLDIGPRIRAQRLLQQRSDELAAANGELEAFAYSVSHDLRAPLRAIDGFSQALLEDYGERMDETGLDYLRRVRAAAQRMAALIDDLLQLSRVSRSQLQPVAVDLSRQAEEILTGLQEQHPERKVEWSVQPGLKAMADPGLLRTVLENLLGNAWKYTARTAAARIEFGGETTPSGTVFHVRDNGAGFDMRYADKLFGAFQRLHHPSEFEGTGIGLATVQRIIHRHGGRIWAHARPGEGATFWFTLGVCRT